MSISELQPPAAVDIPAAADVRIRRQLRSAVAAETRPSRRISTRQAAAIALVAVMALTFAALASTGILQRAVGDLGPGTKSPAAVANQIRGDWTRNLTEGAAQDPGLTFANPAPEQLRARLATAARDYGFNVRDVTILHPKQDAPAIIVQSDTPARLIPQVPAIIRGLDPKAPGADNEGWAYEGFFFEVVDRSGSPVLVVANTWRTPNPGGTQWVAPGYELPYDHL